MNTQRGQGQCSMGLFKMDLSSAAGQERVITAGHASMHTHSGCARGGVGGGGVANSPRITKGMSLIYIENCLSSTQSGCLLVFQQQAASTHGCLFPLPSGRGPSVLLRRESGQGALKGQAKVGRGMERYIHEYWPPTDSSP